MTDRQWVRAVLSHEDGPVPYNVPLSPVAQRRLQAHYGTEDLPEALGVPIRMRGCTSIKPLYASPAEFGPTAKDEFGVVWSTSQIDRGSPVGPCLPDPDLRGYRFPDPAAPHRFEGLADWCEAQGERFTILWIGDLWERATFMRGMEHLLLDVALNRAFVEELLRAIADGILQTERILFGGCRFDGVALSDDYGTQHGMLISPDDWRRLVKPLLAEIYGLAKSHGRIVFHHTCGHVRPIVPDLIDIGLDVLHPIQPEAMDIAELKHEFGGHLTFCGGVPTQNLLPHGTPDEVRREVRRLKEEMSRGGGYILEPGITLQADVPTENLLALIEEARVGRPDTTPAATRTPQGREGR